MFEINDEQTELSPDAARQRKVAQIRKDKGLHQVRLHLDAEALVALKNLADEYGYGKLKDKYNSGKLLKCGSVGIVDELSLLVSFCLRFIADKDMSSKPIFRDCQEYYQTRQVAVYLEKDGKSLQSITNKLKAFKLRTLDMILRERDYPENQAELTSTKSWTVQEVKMLLDEKSFKKDMHAIYMKYA